MELELGLNKIEVGVDEIRKKKTYVNTVTKFTLTLNVYLSPEKDDMMTSCRH